MRLSAPDVLEAIVDAARANPDHPAVRDPGGDLTYAELLDAAALLAHGLATKGVGPGDRVGLYEPNCIDFVVGALACLKIGAIFVPLSIEDPPARLRVIVADCAPTLVLTAPDSVGPRWPLDEPPATTVSELASGSPASPASGGAPTQGAYIIYTSGTTGTPNGVLISRSAFAAAVSATKDALGLGHHTRALCVSPFHFDGSFATLFPTLTSGGTVVLRPREALLFPRTFFKTVSGEAINYTGFSPSYLRLLLADPAFGTLADTTLTLIALGGEASSVEDLRALWAAVPDMVVYNRYGPTETTIAVTHGELTPANVAKGTVPIGRPHRGVTFFLFDDAEHRIEGADEVGHLFIGGSQLMIGYFGAPEATAAVMRSDLVQGELLYRTGDLVSRNGSGDFVYIDRADRVINRRGVRISLVELGDTLRQLQGVALASCVTFDDEGHIGIAAFVVAEGDAALTAPDVRRAAREHLADAMLPDRFEMVRTLPLTSSSKLDERRLLLDAGLTPSPTPRSPHLAP